MLTKSDLAAIGNLIDKKLSTDIAAIQTRIAGIESEQITRFDVMQIRSSLKEIERRVTAVEGKLAKTASKDDLKLLHSHLNKKLNKMSRDMKATTRFFDTEVVDLDKRTDRIEKHLKLPSFSSAS